MSVILLCKITHLFKKFQGFPIQTPFSGIILFCVCETLNSEKILIKKYCCVLFRPLISKADFEPLAKDDSMFPLGSCYAVHWFDRSETGEKDLIYSVPEQQSVHLPVEDPETDLEPKQAPSARHTG